METRVTRFDEFVYPASDGVDALCPSYRDVEADNDAKPASEREPLSATRYHNGGGASTISLK